MNLNDTTSTAPTSNTSYLVRPDGRIGYDVAGTGPLLVLVPGMGDLRAGYRFLAPAQRPELVCGLVLAGPFVRDPAVSTPRRLLLRAAMAPPWAAVTWKSYLPKLYAGLRPDDFGEYRDRVVASLRRPGYARAFSLTTRTSHAPAEALLAQVAVPVLVIMGERDPDFADPAAEAAWIAQRVDAQVVMVPEAGHYPQSQRPDITTRAVLRFLATVNS
jgi:pimeloyl-ACP methyl ester carboxylesterase